VLRMPTGRAPWRARGQALVKHLERQAPCLYLPGDEWAHWRICPRLSDQIGVIGRADSLDPQDLQRAAILGRYANAVVAGSPAIADALIEIDATLLPRLVTIPLPVDVPDRLLERPRASDAPLKVACYEGSGVFDQSTGSLSRIMDALVAAHIPVEMTSVADEGLAPLGRNDVLLIATDFKDVRVWVLEAMGRGCVPVVAGGNRAAADLLEDGENGYLVPDGDVGTFAERLGALQKHEALRRALATKAFETVDRGAYRGDDMVTSYLLLFERVLRDIESGRYRRPTADVPWDAATPSTPRERERGQLQK
jgi:glycosyltransferase involved in cell wall biosynthesis